MSIFSAISDTFYGKKEPSIFERIAQTLNPRIAQFAEEAKLAEEEANRPLLSRITPSVVGGAALDVGREYFTRPIASLGLGFADILTAGRGKDITLQPSQDLGIVGKTLFGEEDIKPVTTREIGRASCR